MFESRTRSSFLLHDLSGSGLAFYRAGSEKNPSFAKARRLSDCVRSTVNVPAVFHEVYVAEDLDEALRLLDTLEPHLSVVLPNGTWLGPQFIRTPENSDVHRGILQREREIHSIEEQCQACLLKYEEKAELLERLQEGLNLERQNLSKVQHERQRLQEDLRAARVELEWLHHQQQQHLNQQERLQRESRTTFFSSQRSQSFVADKTIEHDGFARQIERLASELEEKNPRKKRLGSAKEEAYARVRRLQEEGHRLQLKIEPLKASKPC